MSGNMSVPIGLIYKLVVYCSEHAKIKKPPKGLLWSVRLQPHQFLTLLVSSRHKRSVLMI